MSVFVDTNVLVYARDAARPDKQHKARRWIDRLWETEQGRLSMQVLNEYYVTVTRKLEPGLPPSDARADVRDLLAWSPLAVGADLTVDAWAVEDRFGFSYWDALIVSGAHAAGCHHLLTEDLQDEQDLDGVTVVNPFNHEPRAILGT